MSQVPSSAITPDIEHLSPSTNGSQVIVLVIVFLPRVLAKMYGRFFLYWSGSTNQEFNFRHDWNSLISDNPRMQMRYYSKLYLPHADDYVRKGNFKVKAESSMASILYFWYVLRVRKQCDSVSLAPRVKFCYFTFGFCSEHAYEIVV